MKTEINKNESKTKTFNSKSIVNSKMDANKKITYVEKFDQLRTLNLGQIIAIFNKNEFPVEVARSYIEYSINANIEIANLRFPMNLAVQAFHSGNERAIAIENLKKTAFIASPAIHEIVSLGTDPNFQALSDEGITAIKAKIKKDKNCLTFNVSTKNLQTEAAMVALEELRRVSLEKNILVVMYVNGADKNFISMLRHFLTEEIEIDNCEADSGAILAMTVACPNMLRLNFMGQGKQMVQMHTSEDGLEFKTTEFISESAEVRTMVKMRLAGKTLDAIASHLNTSKATVQRTVAPLNLPKSIVHKKSDSVNKENRISKEVLEKKPDVAKVSETRKRR